jgi:hypothetical protein
MSDDFTSMGRALQCRALELVETRGEWRVLHDRQAGKPKAVIASFVSREDAFACFEVMKDIYQPVKSVIQDCSQNGEHNASFCS